MTTHIAVDDSALIPGRWRLPARLTFWGIVLLTVVLFAGGLPEYYRQLTTICPTAACPNSPTAAIAQTYAAAGLALETVARWFVGMALLAAVVPGLMAMIIVGRRPDNRMAWFTALMLLTFGAFGIHDPTNLTAVLAAYPALWRLPVTALIICGPVCMTLFFFVFPDGRFHPRRWRGPVLVFVAATQVLGQLWPGTVFDNFTWPLALFLAYWIGLFVVLMAVQIHRYRHISNVHQRQQTKWVVLGAVATMMSTMGLYLALTLAPLINPGWQVAGLLAESSYYLCLQILPLAIGFAMFRSGLYDVDVIINRALVYGLLTALLAAIYAGLVIGLQWLVTAVTGQTSDLALIGSTLAIVALFQPLRRGVAAFIDRRFYRRRYDGQQVLTAFAGVLRDQPYTDPDALSRVLLNVVEETIQPAHATLRLVEGPTPPAAPKAGG